MAQIDLGCLFPKRMGKPVTVGEAVTNVQNKTFAPTSEKLTIIAPFIKQGQDARSVPVAVLKKHYPSMLDKMRRHSFEKRVRRSVRDRPHQTIAKQFVMCNAEHYLHFDEDRYFTTEELMRCGSFPDGYNLIGNYSKTVERIGRETGTGW